MVSSFVWRMEPQDTYTDGLGRLVVERDKVQQKLAKVKHRRDHYARLYYRTLAQLDETKWELATAKHTIHQLQHSTMSGATTCSQDSGTWLSPSQQWRTIPAFTLSQTDTPPIAHRQLSAHRPTTHRQLPTSSSVPSFSAFRPLKPSNVSPVDMPAYDRSNRGSDKLLCHEELTGLELLDLLAVISAPHCSIHSLEIANSQLGQPEAMKVFCADLSKNTSITSLSLPDNGIAGPSLSILLDTVKSCSHLKELLLRNNRIGAECVEAIKHFLSLTTLDSLVLTGNEIEQYSHLLSGELPGEFAMECSGDSGVVATLRDTLDCMHV